MCDNNRTIMLLNYVIQIMAGLILIYFLWGLSSYVEIMDKRVLSASMYADPMSFDGMRVQTTVFEGYADGMSLRGKKFDTISNQKSNYRDFGGGGNGGTSGGSTFTYSFWALVRDPMAIFEYPAKCPLFVKGDPKRYKTFTEQEDTQDRSRSRVIVTEEVLVKSPMFSIYRKGDILHLVVDVNTTKDLHSTVVINGRNSEDSTMRYNVMSLVIGRWTLWTLSVQDTPKGCVVTFFVNDMPIHSQTLSGHTVLPNQGDIVLFPDMSNQPSNTLLSGWSSAPSPNGEWRNTFFMADLQFSNFAHTQADINERLSAGVSQTFATIQDSAVLPDSVMKLSVVNRIDMGNVGPNQKT